MEFEFTGTIYIDTDAIFEECVDNNSIDTDSIRETVNYFLYTHADENTAPYIEGWMIDKVVTEVKKRVDKELNA